MNILMNFKAHFPELCRDEIEELLTNLSEKDWELYRLSGKTQLNEKDSSIATVGNTQVLVRPSRNSLHDRRLSLREKI
jgi:succinate dehydrogenase flavin-adding protein (antitoxin of CptAB toxin-antitoxin module)